jgi:hypothetical protein
MMMRMLYVYYEDDGRFARVDDGLKVGTSKSQVE